MTGFKGDEFFHSKDTYLDFNISDFWRWAFGNLLDNTKRGALAEYLIQRALGLDTSETQEDWSSYDILYNDIPIEVKSAAYIQAWNLGNSKLSDILFSIRPASFYDETTSTYSSLKSRNSKIYIFSVYEEVEKSRVDVSDLSKWGFYIVPTVELDRHFPSQKTISLKSLMATIKPVRQDWFNLKSAVDKVIPTL